MIRDRSGQAAIEAIVVAPVLILLLAAGGVLSLAPLAVFFVEDHMEEALQCSTSRPVGACRSAFERGLDRSGLRRWVRSTHLGCDPHQCRMIVRWSWPRPLPSITDRRLARIGPHRASAASPSSSF